MRKLNLLFSFFIVLFLGALPNQSLFGQCTVHGIINNPMLGSNSNLPINTPIGQNFLPCQTGNVTSITLVPATNPGVNGTPGTYDLFLDVDPGNGVPSVFGVYQTFVVTLADLDNPFTISLNTPFPVTAGTLYRFQIRNTTSNNWRFLSPGSNPYPDGNLVNNIGQFSTSFDMDFSVQIAPIAPITPDPQIPTLSQWGLLIFGLLILNLGLVLVYRTQLGGVGNMNASINSFPFDKKLFLQYFGMVLGLFVVGFMVAIVAFGYEMMPFDVSGSILTAGLLGYLTYLLKSN